MTKITSRQPSCLVLGGGGFIGTNLCRHLARSGFRVRAFGRTLLFPAAMAGIEWREGAFEDAEALAAALESFDVVVHLIHGTTPQGANEDAAGDAEGIIRPSLVLMELCGKLGVGRIVFASSGGTVYGVSRELPTTETAPTNPTTAYGISKLTIEKYLAFNNEVNGLDYRVLRIANPFGPFQTAGKGQGFIAALVSRALTGKSVEIWGDGTVVRDFIFVDDVINAILAAMTDRGPEKVFNIGTGTGRNLRSVVTSVESLLKLRIEVVSKPERAFDIPVSILSIKRAQSQLGWAPEIGFEQGLCHTIDWWRSVVRK